MQRCGSFLTVILSSRHKTHTRSQTKQGALRRSYPGPAWKECQVMGCVRSDGVAVVPWPLSRWPVGSLLTETEDWRGRGRESSRLGAAVLQLKGRLVLLFAQNSRTILQFSSQQKASVCVSWCVGTPLSLSDSQPCSAWINSARKTSVVVLKESSRCDKFDNWLYVDFWCSQQAAVFSLFISVRALFIFSAFM